MAFHYGDVVSPVGTTSTVDDYCHQIVHPVRVVGIIRLEKHKGVVSKGIAQHVHVNSINMYS